MWNNSIPQINKGCWKDIIVPLLLLFSFLSSVIFIVVICEMKKRHSAVEDHLKLTGKLCGSTSFSLQGKYVTICMLYFFFYSVDYQLQSGMISWPSRTGLFAGICSSSCGWSTSAFWNDTDLHLESKSEYIVDLPEWKVTHLPHRMEFCWWPLCLHGLRKACQWLTEPGAWAAPKSWGVAGHPVNEL